jgi:hypothetical protein
MLNLLEELFFHIMERFQILTNEFIFSMKTSRYLKYLNQRLSIINLNPRERIGFSELATSVPRCDSTELAEVLLRG